MASTGLLLLRLVVGLTMAAHGSQKLFGWFGGSGITGWATMVDKLRIRPAQPWAWIAALSEFGGGVLIALGLFWPLGSFMIVGAMLVAIATVHWPKGFFVTKGGYEFNLVLIAASLGMALTGPGSLALDSALGLHLPEPATVIVLAVATLAGVAGTLASRRPAQPVTKAETA